MTDYDAHVTPHVTPVGLSESSYELRLFTMQGDMCKK